MGIGDFIGTLTSAMPTAASPLERSQRAMLDLVLTPVRGLGGHGGAASVGDAPGNAGPAPAPAIPPGSSTPGDDCQNLTLPDDILAIVEPVLKKFGISVKVTRKNHKVLPCSSVHEATFGDFKAYLLHFDASVLEDPLKAKDVLTVGYYFRKGEIIRVLSRGCNDPDPAFDFTWGTWGEQGIATEYVQWRDIGRLRSLEVEKRPDFLKLRFRLPDNMHPLDAPEPARLLDDPVSFKQLVDIIAANGATVGIGVSAFINNVLIGALPEDLRKDRSEWGNSYEAGARELLQWIEKKGNHPTRKGYTCTAVLLETFLDGQTQDGRDLILGAIERFQLVTSDQELAALKKRYGGKG